jgi:putative aldouronate transport system substrate-binding protein
MIDKFASMPTQTKGENNATLDTRELEVFTKIIIGDSLDNFDKFVDEWYKLGGEQMTNEVNAWYLKNK